MKPDHTPGTVQGGSDLDGARGLLDKTDEPEQV